MIRDHESVEREDDEYIQFQENLRNSLFEMIKQSGLTQAEVAKKCGWFIGKDNKPDQARVSAYSTGDKFSLPAFTTILREVFNISLVDFIASLSHDAELSWRAGAIVQVMKNLTEKQQDALITVSQAMKNSE